MDSLKNEMQRRADSIIQEISEDIKYQINLYLVRSLSDLSDDTWSEIYESIVMGGYIRQHNGNLSLEVTVGDDPKDSRFFDLKEIAQEMADGYELKQKNYNMLAAQFEEAAQILRNARSAT